MLERINKAEDRFAVFGFIYFKRTNHVACRRPCRCTGLGAAADKSGTVPIRLPETVSVPWGM